MPLALPPPRFFLPARVRARARVLCAWYKYVVSSPCSSSSFVWSWSWCRGTDVDDRASLPSAGRKLCGQRGYMWHSWCAYMVRCVCVMNEDGCVTLAAEHRNIPGRDLRRTAVTRRLHAGVRPWVEVDRLGDEAPRRRLVAWSCLCIKGHSMPLFADGEECVPRAPAITAVPVHSVTPAFSPGTLLTPPRSLFCVRSLGAPFFSRG